jgi:hypothetical protein
LSICFINSLSLFYIALWRSHSDYTYLKTNKSFLTSFNSLFDEATKKKSLNLFFNYLKSNSNVDKFLFFFADVLYSLIQLSLFLSSIQTKETYNSNKKSFLSNFSKMPLIQVSVDIFSLTDEDYIYSSKIRLSFKSFLNEYYLLKG